MKFVRRHDRRHDGFERDDGRGVRLAVENGPRRSPAPRTLRIDSRPSRSVKQIFVRPDSTTTT